jgi:hypothetical protein
MLPIIVNKRNGIEKISDWVIAKMQFGYRIYPIYFVQPTQAYERQAQ